MALHPDLPRRLGGSEIRSLSAPPSPNQITLIGVDPSTELYQTLLPWQTRLLKLHPGKELGLVSCQLETVEVTAQEGLGMVSEARFLDYEALSCSWRSTESTTVLNCNGISIKVSQPVSEALQYLRYEDEPRWIWCDALCINHEDPVEKSAQTRMMFLILEKATSIIAWLGLPDEDAETVLQAIDLFPDGGRGSSAVFMTAIQDFVSRPWFQSIWSRQDVAAARQITLQCGDYNFLFHQFCRFALKTGVQGPIEVLFNDHLESQKRTLHNYERNITDIFFNLLSQGSIFTTPDCRDRVYSALALADNIWRKSDRRGFIQEYPIDYTLRVDDVFEDVMKFIVNKERSLAILNVLGPRDLTSRIPSWHCDWRKAGLYLPSDRRACAGRLPPMSIKDGCLTLIGSFVGTVDKDLDWIAEPVTGTISPPRLRSRRSSVNLPAGLNIKKSKHKDGGVLELCNNGAYVFHTIKFADGTRSTAVGVAAPFEAQKGDEIAVVHGCSAPFVLRWSENGFKVVGAGWMWNTFSSRSHEDELHHYCDFDSWAQTLYRAECNEPVAAQALMRRSVKTMSWHRRYWAETGQIYSEEEARVNNFGAFGSHKEWIEHAAAGNGIREYTLC